MALEALGEIPLQLVGKLGQTGAPLCHAPATHGSGALLDGNTQAKESLHLPTNLTSRKTQPIPRPIPSGSSHQRHGWKRNTGLPENPATKSAAPSPKMRGWIFRQSRVSLPTMALMGRTTGNGSWNWLYLSACQVRGQVQGFPAWATNLMQLYSWRVQKRGMRPGHSIPGIFKTAEHLSVQHTDAPPDHWTTGPLVGRAPRSTDPAIRRCASATVRRASALAPDSVIAHGLPDFLYLYFEHHQTKRRSNFRWPKRSRVRLPKKVRDIGLHANGAGLPPNRTAQTMPKRSQISCKSCDVYLNTYRREKTYIYMCVCLICLLIEKSRLHAPRLLCYTSSLHPLNHFPARGPFYRSTTRCPNPKHGPVLRPAPRVG